LDWITSFPLKKRKNDPFFQAHLDFFRGLWESDIPSHFHDSNPKNQGRMWQDKSRSKGEGKGSSPKASVRIAVISVPWVG